MASFGELRFSLFCRM